jgi:hypothetical protein
MRIILFLVVIFLFLIISYFILFSQKPESQLCNPCEINNCICNIKYCERGMADIYNNPNCAGVPLFAIPFSSNEFKWKPSEKGDYYLKLLCEDKDFSICLPITVS